MALQLDQYGGNDARKVLPNTASTTTSQPVITSAVQASPLPKSSVVVPSRTYIQTRDEDAYTLNHGTQLEARSLKKMAPDPTPRPPEPEYPDPTGLATAYCGWQRPRWVQDGFVANRPDWSSVSNFASIKEDIPVFTTTDPSWCPCTVLLYPLGEFWDTNDEGCRSVLNLISTMRTPGYKMHIWPQPSTASFQRMQIVTEPPSSITVPWGYPMTNSNGELMFPLEVRTPKFELRDVFGNQLTDRNTTASFPVSYRWNPWEIGLITFREEWDDPDMFPWSSAYLAGPATPCMTDVRESDILFNTDLFDVTVGSCPDPAESYKTVWWTLPFGRQLFTNTSTVEEALPTAGTASPGSGGDVTSTGDVQVTSVSVLPASSLPRSTLAIGSATSIKSNSLPSRSTLATTGQDGKATTSQSRVSTDTKALHEIPPLPTSSNIRGPALAGKSTVTSEIAEWGPRPSHHTGAHPEQSIETGKSNTTPSGLLIPLAGGSTMTRKITKPGQTNSHSTPLDIIAIVSVSEHIIATGPVPANETRVLGAETPQSESLTASHSTAFLLTDSDTPPARKQTIDASVLAWDSSVDDHTATNRNKSVMIAEPTPTVTTSMALDPRPNFSIRPSWGGPIPPDAHEKFFNLRSETDYLIVSLVPVLLATLLGIPIQIFVASLNSLLPFRALGDEHGAYANDCLYLPRSSWLAPLIGYRFLVRFKDPLPLLAVLLDTLSTVLVPLSTETIQMEFTSMGCRRSRYGLVCAYGLRKVEAPIRAVESTLVAIAVLVIVMAYLLARWRTGFATEPWSIASMAGLLRGSDGEVHDLLRKIPTSPDYEKCLGESQITGWFKDRRYRLGFHTAANAEPRYGIYVVPAAEDNSAVRRTIRDPKTNKPVPVPAAENKKNKWKFWQHMQPSTQRTTTQVITLLLVIGLLTLILYYENTSLDTPFERFMNSQSFGVRLLFTSFGTAVSGLWSYHFSQTAESQIFNQLSTPKTARESILLSPPTNVFIGLWRFFRTKDILSFNIALATMLAKFTPILFSNIPFRNTVTWKLHEACTWMAVGVLSYMVIVLSVGLLLSTHIVSRLGLGKKRWGRSNADKETEPVPVDMMPVKADTILGYMYYLVESKMVRDMEGMEMLSKRERDRLVGEMGRLYVFGEVPQMEGQDGAGGQRQGGTRVGVDYFTTGPAVLSK